MFVSDAWERLWVRSLSRIQMFFLGRNYLFLKRLLKRESFSLGLLFVARYQAQVIISCYTKYNYFENHTWEQLPYHVTEFKLKMRFSFRLKFVTKGGR